MVLCYDLRAEFEKVKSNKKKLQEFHNKLASLNFFDPACGCGNFLVLAYRELRLLEMDVLEILHKDGQRFLATKFVSQVDVDQFYHSAHFLWDKCYEIQQTIISVFLHVMWIICRSSSRGQCEYKENKRKSISGENYQ